METDLPFRIIFCFDHGWKITPDGGLVYDFHCVSGRNTRPCDARREPPVSTPANASGRPVPLARRAISFARSSNDNRQRFLLQA
jgi:hypothetical protein